MKYPNKVNVKHGDELYEVEILTDGENHAYVNGQETIIEYISGDGNKVLLLVPTKYNNDLISYYDGVCNYIEGDPNLTLEENVENNTPIKLNQFQKLLNTLGYLLNLVLIILLLNTNSGLTFSVVWLFIIMALSYGAQYIITIRKLGKELRKWIFNGICIFEIIAAVFLFFLLIM